MMAVEISELLRRRIIADLHLGRLKPGNRLPSLRELARELSVSVRAAARAYAELQEEGLVTVRGRSGIYLAAPPVIEIRFDEPLDWYEDMLGQAWARRIRLTDIKRVLSELLENPMEAACVESTEDHMVAFCAELEEDFGLKTTSVKLVAGGAAIGDQPMSLYDALGPVDFVVTTAFHTREVRAVTDVLKKPVVLVSVNETLVRLLEKQLATAPITLVAEDPRFVERFRTYLAESFRKTGDMRAISLDELQGNSTSTANRTLLYTRAARRRLREEEYHLLPPPVPFVSAGAARRVVQCMLSTHEKRALLA